VRVREEPVQQQDRRGGARHRSVIGPFEVMQAQARSFEMAGLPGTRERTGDELVEAAALEYVGGSVTGSLHRSPRACCPD
jgi:hypothetical protein